MIMKRIFKTSIFLAISLMATTTFTSCEDYLDKEPESTLSGDDAFKNFTI